MNKKIQIKSSIAAAAVSGLLLGASFGCTAKVEESKAPSAAHTTPAGNAAALAIAEKHACKGFNSCKGNGGCKVVGTNECAGKNACKGKGGCATVAHHDCGGKNACKGQGGCKSEKNECAGKNACKGQGGCSVPHKH